MSCTKDFTTQSDAEEELIQALDTSVKKKKAATVSKSIELPALPVKKKKKKTRKAVETWKPKKNSSVMKKLKGTGAG